MEEASVCRHRFVQRVRMVLSNFRELSDATGEAAADVTWLANRGRFANHYRTRWVPKRVGRRLLEAPARRIAHVQRVILRQLLDNTALHPCAMAFRKGHGVLAHARVHVGRRWVVRMDLCDFFATIGVARVAGVFRKLGYVDELGRVLADLTTNAVTLDGDATRSERQLYGRRHLPQGAPTSPALANLIAARLDRRLDALSRSLGGAYSRYADDLVVSCDRHLPWLVPRIGAIAMEEGFSVRFRKTRVMSAASQQMVTGLVVNERVGMSRRARKQLEALLFNCVRHGPASQDRAAHGARFCDHLRGRVAYAHQVDPDRSTRLVTLFDAIDWQR